MQEPWHKKAITEYKKEVIKATMVALAAAFAVGLLCFALGRRFALQEVHLPEPTLTLRILSGLVFDSLGYILYELKFYYVLYMIFVVFLRMRELYNALKTVIWYGLMFVMGFYIVPWIMNVLNFILTILLNTGMAIVYAAPSIGVFIVVFPTAFYFLKKKTEEAPEVVS